MVVVTENTHIACWTGEYLRQYLNGLQGISYVSKEVGVLMFPEGTERCLLPPDLFNELVDRVEVPEYIQFLMCLTFEVRFGLFEQPSYLCIRILQT